MVVIYSIHNDGSTSEVIKWINNISDIEVLRINLDKDEICFVEFNELESKFLISINDKIFNLYECEAFWYRKGGKILQKNRTHSFNVSSEILNKNIQYKIKEELRTLNEFILFFLENHSKITLGSGFNATLNKLNILFLAKKYGLKTPRSFISKNAQTLKNLITTKGISEVITKAMSDGMYLIDNQKSFISYTELIDENYLKTAPEHFIESLFQEKIEKKYELRVFYLNGDFYSMAIFSQNSKKTEIDFRRYDKERPNRYVPYNLPSEIKNCLLNLFNALNLNTGSVDLVVDVFNNFYFLEINPVGQFSMVSYPCNYNLEKLVAEYLIGKN